MKLSTLFLLTHGIAAATIASLFVAASQSASPLFLSGAAVISLVTLAAASWFASARIQNGLSVIESVVADNEASESLNIGLREFDHSAQTIGKCAARWEAVAANTRQQSHDFQAMMLLLNRRGATGEPSSSQLRGLLAGLGNTLHTQLQQIERGSTEIEQHASAIAEGTEAQGHAVIKTTGYVEQMSSTIDSVSNSAASVQSAIQSTNDSASDTLDVVRELCEGMKRIRTESHTREKKLRGLCDPSQQISSIVGTISDIAARTDLLALNASIEAIRAGEHGRGFAIVADEVRKLAEQSTDATREISSLIESMLIVMQESINGVVRDREQVDVEIGHAATAERALEQICDDFQHNDQHVRQITTSSNQQLQLAQDVVLAVEHISTLARSNRGSAESVCWTMKTLTKTTPQFNIAIDRLRSCSGDSTGEFDDSMERSAQQKSTVQENPGVPLESAARPAPVVPGAPLTLPASATDNMAQVGR